MEAHLKFGFDWLSDFWGVWTMDGQATYELKGSGELIKEVIQETQQSRSTATRRY